MRFIYTQQVQQQAKNGSENTISNSSNGENSSNASSNGSISNGENENGLWQIFFFSIFDTFLGIK